MAQLSRRYVIGLGIGAVGASWLRPAAAEEAAEAHGMSAFGDLKYPADFHHFDYVNLNAPKGGLFSTIPSGRAFNQSFQTFNSLNAYILKGDGAQGMGMTFAALMARAGDEPDAMYGLVAKSVAISPDGLVYRFTLRPEARFHDGTKLTARDAAFSLNILKSNGHPIITQQVRDMLKAEAVDDATLVVTFAPKRGRDVPLFVASLPIFSQSYYATHPFDETTQDIPLGSGPYKVSKFEVNRYIEFERVRDWWGADLPVNRGSYNFDALRFEFYRDRDVAFEGFTGGNYLFREEFTSRIWNTRYDFPALIDGRVKRELLPDDTPSGAQGWFFNTRRDKFKDPRVREALGNAFDFEWTNKTIMYGAYVRTHSPFQNSDLMANGPPSPEEIALLEPFRGKVPDEVFGLPYAPPVSDGSGQDRALLRKAVQLLQDAGCAMKDGKRMTPQGEAFRVEFLLDEAAFQAHHMPYIKNLGTLGIEATLRLVDPVQFFSSRAAATKGTNNLAGISDPVVDAMVEQLIAADTRPKLVFAARALDRIIRAGRYWVPQWYANTHRLAYWDVFGHPPNLPKYLGAGVPDLWWSVAKSTTTGEQAK
jgi:microcin C transport system substrate-binding protein